MKTLRAAKHYRANGLSVIPTNPKTKQPYWNKLPKRLKGKRMVGVWHPFQETVADEETINRWFADGRANVSIVTGAVSGNLVVLDFDHEASEVFPQWMETIGPLSEKLPVAKTGKGKHVYVRFPIAMANKKLAYTKDGKVRIETRGEGGYVQAPPSLHNSGVTYAWERQYPCKIPLLSQPAAQHLLEVSFLFNLKVKNECQRRQSRQTAVRQVPVDDAEIARRLKQYAERAVKLETVALGQVAEGSRNDALNRAAFRVGRFVGCGELQAEKVRHLFYEACLQNGYLHDDGEHAFERTFRSGLQAGASVADFREQLLARLIGAEPEVK